MTLGLAIFAATYIRIAVQRLPFVRLNRPAASLLGAVAMVVLGVLPLRDAYAAIDFDVLVFLLGLLLRQTADADLGYHQVVEPNAA